MNDQSSRPSMERDVDILVDDVARIESIFDNWEEGQRTVVLGFRRAIEALHKDALRKLISAMKDAPGGLDVLRATAQDPVVYMVLRHHGLLRASLQERVEQALESIRPMLAAHGGNVELVSVAPPDSIDVRFLGNCDNCPSSTLTFVAGVKQAITEHCPEIQNIRQVKGRDAKATGAAAAGIAFSSPFQESLESAWIFATKLDTIPDGGVKEFTIAGKPIFLSRFGRLVSGFDNLCPHFGFEIAGGRIDNGRIACPYHGFIFDLMSGVCLTAPDVHLTSHAIRLIGDRVEISLWS